MADSYAPTPSSSAIIHSDQQKALTVTQRFGDIKTLITHTVDPLVSEYFRDLEM